MRYISFSEKTMQITDECVETAAAIWHDCDFDAVRFMAGFSGYGKTLAVYRRESKIVYVAINPKFRKLRVSRDGLDIVDSHGYIGTILHELGHHASRYAPDEYPDSGAETHKTPAWIWICVTGWQYFFPGNGLTIGRVMRALRIDDSRVGYYLSHFHPNNSPEKLVELVSELLADDADSDLPDGIARCRQCGATFKYQRRTAKYCSAKCRVSANRTKSDSASPSYCTVLA